LDDRFDPNGEPRPLTDRATVRRLPQRGAYDSKTIHAILDAGFLAHVGFCIDGQPFVIPTLYGRAKDTEGPDKLYLHGSAASRMLRELSAGVPACVTVTHVDGIVLARSAFHHSMNYRSVVAFGTARKIDDVQGKAEALRVVADHLIAGRWEEVRSPTAKELKATSVLEFTIEDASAKIRSGPPIDDEDDYALSVWAGVVPLHLQARAPLRDSRLAKDIVTPEYVHKFHVNGDER
jgi:nitroimidazol reductase NimA-like FMN-containing flavoprotein (pyridoxamine 5'-phosphate oxidase superfamily)